MNWLASTIKIKNIIKPGLIVLIPVFFGCDSAEDFGTEFNLDTNVDVNVVDLNLPATNLYLDSLRTDGEDRILAGRYTDPMSGTIEANGYFQYFFSGVGTLPTELNASSDTLTLDSLVLQLEVLNTLGNIGTPLELEIYEIQDTLQSVIYLANQQQTLAGSPVVTFTGSPSNIFDEDNQVVKNADSVIRQSLNIEIPDSYAQALFNEISAIIRGGESLSASRFSDLAIVPSSSAESLAEISTLSPYSVLTFFMDDPDDDSLYRMQFPLNGIEYSSINREFASSPFSIIEGNEESKQNIGLPDGTTVLDPLAGITTTFSLESLDPFFASLGQVLINSATIDFEIQDDLPRDTVDFFRLYFRKSDGGIFSPASEFGIGTGLPTLSFSNIVMTDEGYLRGADLPLLAGLDEDGYVVNPTLFMQSLYNAYQEEGVGRLAYINRIAGDTVDVSELVMVSPIDVTTQQTIFKNSGINLRVFYTEVD